MVATPTDALSAGTHVPTATLATCRRLCATPPAPCAAAPKDTPPLCTTAPARRRAVARHARPPSARSASLAVGAAPPPTACAQLKAALRARRRSASLNHRASACRPRAHRAAAVALRATVASSARRCRVIAPTPACACTVASRGTSSFPRVPPS